MEGDRHLLYKLFAVHYGEATGEKIHYFTVLSCKSISLSEYNQICFRYCNISLTYCLYCVHLMYTTSQKIGHTKYVCIIAVFFVKIVKSEL